LKPLLDIHTPTISWGYLIMLPDSASLGPSKPPVANAPTANLAALLEEMTEPTD